MQQEKPFLTPARDKVAVVTKTTFIIVLTTENDNRSLIKIYFGINLRHSGGNEVGSS